ncbi:hypothetical protein BH10ACT4_BH10ACT4_10360 [soil metagenome]
MTVYPPPTPGYIAQPYVPRPVRPPLTARAKRGAALGGAFGFTLLTIGYGLVAIPVAIGLVLAFFAAIVGLARGRNGQFADGSFGGFDVSRIDLSPWIALLVASAVVGIVLMIAAVLLSSLVLRRHGVRRPWGVTFAGAGIAIVGAWIVEGFLGAIASGVGSASFDGRSFGPGIIAGIIVSAVVALAVNAVIGWLCWWWMAHAMRPAATAPDPTAAGPSTTGSDTIGHNA